MSAKSLRGVGLGEKAGGKDVCPRLFFQSPLTLLCPQVLYMESPSGLEEVGEMAPHISFVD